MRASGLMLAAVALAVSSAAFAQTVPCAVKLNITDQDPAGVNVRADPIPGGAIVTALKARGRWLQADVIAQSGAWAMITKATFTSEDNAGGTIVWKGAGWVSFSRLGIEELNPNAVIHARPVDVAPVLLTVNEGDEAKIPKAEVIGCNSDWLKVRVRGIVGWTRDFCSNQLTTCV